MGQHEEHAGNSRGSEQATLAGGCFWCLEAVFELLNGVEKVESGYAGGQTPFPSYEQVCSGTTGHAEVVQLTYDPEIVSYRELLDVFFSMHDPTTLNRQGPDQGTAYRSAIFYHDVSQQATAEALIQELALKALWSGPIVTEVTHLEVFYPAEGYHQEYFRRNAQQPYCQYIIAPKVAKLRKEYLVRLRA